MESTVEELKAELKESRVYAVEHYGRLVREMSQQLRAKVEDLEDELKRNGAYRSRD
ncbi:43529_t:CDS:2 [Gigaspora margarita]|uniref:43529_t:CDS:1 n=1 Tax=Gigaspora margarita TaxID=4874 RepID=A0ABN7VEE5_GIGMA|nr:43529_t:CDS:2 [Gigaspora margarita]